MKEGSGLLGTEVLRQGKARRVGLGKTRNELNRLLDHFTRARAEAKRDRYHIYPPPLVLSLSSLYTRPSFSCLVSVNLYSCLVPVFDHLVPTIRIDFQFFFLSLSLPSSGLRWINKSVRVRFLNSLNVSIGTSEREQNHGRETGGMQSRKRKSKVLRGFHDFPLETDGVPLRSVGTRRWKKEQSNTERHEQKLISK